MDYNSLTAPKGTPGSIANWANYSSTILPLADILTDAQALLINGGVVDQSGVSIPPLRLIAMQEMLTLALPANAATLTAPSDYLHSVLMQNPYGARIPMKDLSSVLMRQVYNSGGQLQTAAYPNVYAFADGEFVFDMPPNANLSLPFAYVGSNAVAPLSALNPTNLLTTKYPHLLRAACLAVAADFLNDDNKYTRYGQRLVSMLKSINAADDLAFMTGEVDRVDRGL